MRLDDVILIWKQVLPLLKIIVNIFKDLKVNFCVAFWCFLMDILEVFNLTLKF